MQKIFRTEEYLGSRKKDYFEGWYFRHGGDFPFAYIAGISKSKDDEHCFIQYIDTIRSEYIRFPIDDFFYSRDDMSVIIKNNVFSKSGLSVDIPEKNLFAKLEYRGITAFKKSPYSPSVMGPFSYIPMVCNHCVVSMSHNFEGVLGWGESRTAVGGLGYIEKDYGNKFPENYFWMHAISGETSIMCAVAWPLVFSIRGFLCIVSHKGMQHNLSLYTGAKLSEFEMDGSGARLHIKRGRSSVDLNITNGSTAQKLVAPNRNGNMNIIIDENLSAGVKLRIKLNGTEIEPDIETCAFESVVK